MAQKPLKTPAETARRRGRPPVGTEEERRRCLFAAAESLFLEQGFGAVTMEQVAKRAGVSKKTIYAFVDTKEHLFDAMMRDHMSRQHLPDLADVADGAGVESAVADYLTTLSAAILSPVAVGLFRLSVGEATRFPNIAQSFYQAGALGHIERLAGWLAAQAKRGLIVLDDAKEAAMMLTSFVVLEPLRAAALGVRALPGAKAQKERAKMAAKLFVRGCAA
jgi:AcrR family transcriptional regulator